MSKGSKRGVAMLAALVTLLTSCSTGDTSAAVSERELPLATYDEYQEAVSVLFNHRRRAHPLDRGTGRRVYEGRRLRIRPVRRAIHR